MKKLTNIFYLLLPLLFLFSSCEDDPVKPRETKLDTARYNWRMEGPMSGDIKGIWAYDTNNIFFMDVANLDLMKYDGNQYTRFHYSSMFTIDFAAWCINGVSPTEVYLGGDDNRITEPTFGKPQFKKWIGGTFETINIPDTSAYHSYISSIYTGVPGVLWIGTNKGRVLKYQNGLFEETFIDTSQYISRFLKDETGSLYFLEWRDSCNSNGTWCKLFVSIFKFDNSIWNKVFYREYNNVIAPIPKNLGNEIYACDYNAFYKFTNNDFVKVVDIYGFRAGTFYWAGSKQSDIMCVGSPSPGTIDLFHWNGKLWSDERVQFYEWELEIFNIQKKYLVTASDGVSSETFIYHGTPK